MEKIACIGWGSLIWNPQDLLITGEWQGNGPQIPLEFARQSRDGRITLVIVPAAKPVTALWSLMSISDLARARESLRDREQTNAKYIGSWSKGDESPELISDLADWANLKGMSHVIWTALPPKFGGTDGIIPSADQVVTYLRGLNGNARVKSEEYIRRAPRQVKTAYRDKIEIELGWTPTNT